VPRGLLAGTIASTCLVCLACHTSSPPAVDPSVRIYQELLDAGCVSPSDDAALAGIAAEQDAGDEPAWLLCLYQGGTIALCNVPCGPDD
jgi:hypothetical protein